MDLPHGGWRVIIPRWADGAESDNSTGTDGHRDAETVTRGRPQTALSETVNGLYKAECVYGPDATGWDDVDQLELETLSWVHWYNHERLHGHCADVPPAEFEAAFYAVQQPSPAGVGNQ